MRVADALDDNPQLNDRYHSIVDTLQDPYGIEDLTPYIKTLTEINNMVTTE